MNTRTIGREILRTTIIAAAAASLLSLTACGGSGSISKGPNGTSAAGSGTISTGDGGGSSGTGTDTAGTGTAGQVREPRYRRKFGDHHRR